MSDLETLKDMFTRLGKDFKEDTTSGHVTLAVEGGYNYLYTEFTFDALGSLTAIGSYA